MLRETSNESYSKSSNQSTNSYKRESQRRSTGPINVFEKKALTWIIEVEEDWVSWCQQLGVGVRHGSSK